MMSNHGSDTLILSAPTRSQDCDFLGHATDHFIIMCFLSIKILVKLPKVIIKAVTE